MIKSALAAVAAAPFFASSALAGPYVNIESNAGFVGNDYQGALTEMHVGYEGPVGESASWYIQGGPAISVVDGVDGSTTEGSGKVGIGVDVTDKVNVYGELWAITAGEFDLDEDLTFNTKVGVKYTF